MVPDVFVLLEPTTIQFWLFVMIAVIKILLLATTVVCLASKVLLLCAGTAAHVSVRHSAAMAKLPAVMALVRSMVMGYVA